MKFLDSDFLNKNNHILYDKFIQRHLGIKFEDIKNYCNLVKRFRDTKVIHIYDTDDSDNITFHLESTVFFDILKADNENLRFTNYRDLYQMSFEKNSIILFFKNNNSHTNYTNTIRYENNFLILSGALNNDILKCTDDIPIQIILYYGEDFNRYSLLPDEENYKTLKNSYNKESHNILQFARGNFSYFLENTENSWVSKSRGEPFIDMKGNKVNFLINLGDGYIGKVPVERYKLKDYLKENYSEENKKSDNSYLKYRGIFSLMDNISSFHEDDIDGYILNLPDLNTNNIGDYYFLSINNNSRIPSSIYIEPNLLMSNKCSVWYREMLNKHLYQVEDNFLKNGNFLICSSINNKKIWDILDLGEVIKAVN